MTTGKVNGRFKDQIISDLKHRPEGVRIKHRAGGNSVKAYNEHAQLLRVETTLNQPEVFKVYRPKSNDQTQSRAKARRWQRLRRSIVDLPRRAEVSRAANHRYLQAIASTQGNLALGQAVAAWTVAVRWNGRRYRGIHPFEPHDSALLESAEANGLWRVFATATSALAFTSARPRIPAGYGAKVRPSAADCACCAPTESFAKSPTPIATS